MPDTLKNRIQPHPGCPFKCLMFQFTTRGAPLCAWCTEQLRRPTRQGSPLSLKKWSYRERLAKVAFWSSSYAATAKSLQSCPTLCDPTDGSPPGSAIPGILQARTLEWVAISFSNAWKWSRSVSVQLFVTPWTTAYQAPPSMGFSRLTVLISHCVDHRPIGSWLPRYPAYRDNLCRIERWISFLQRGK